MKYRKFDNGEEYFVSVYDGQKWMTFSFLDWESQNVFCIALDNAIDMEEIDEWI